MSLKKILIDIDKQINYNIKGNNNMTISRQSARGLQKRLNYTVSDSKAMKMTHGNMITSGTAIVGGAALMKSNPVLGFVCVLAGGLLLSRITGDWNEGNCCENEICR